MRRPKSMHILPRVHRYGRIRLGRADRGNRRIGAKSRHCRLGAPGDGDDVAAAPLKRSKKAVTVRVPLGAVSGPLLVSDRDGLESPASTVPLAVATPASLKLAAAAPRIEVQTH